MLCIPLSSLGFDGSVLSFEQVTSEAGMRYAGEVFQPGNKGGVAAGEGELSREDRKRARAGKKRAGKKRRTQKVKQRLNLFQHWNSISHVCPHREKARRQEAPRSATGK